MTIEDESARLLLWVNARTGGDSGHIVDLDAKTDPDWQHLSDADVIMLIEQLEHGGLVTTRGAFASGTACRITPVGVAESDRLVRERDSPRGRFDFAANSLVAAAMEDYPQVRVELGTFVGTRRMWFYDSVLDLDEVLRAVRYLEDNQLAIVEGWPAQPRAIILTPLGTECGSDNTISVRKFLSEQQDSRRPNISFNGPVSGLQVGDNNTQNNTFGYDPGQLADFAREVLAAAQTEDVSNQGLAEVTADVEALQAELATAAPDAGRVRGLFQKAVESAKTYLPPLGWLAAAQAISAATGVPIAF
ncbi:hypothetical protein ACFY8C_02915 [Streptomyces flavochromogenes]|uniref:Uncharacterized protein n=1 Tax=Streptomyces flavochromogenes TaxID=68199 RepID=A0ABW6XII2_9ACTN